MLEDLFSGFIKKYHIIVSDDGKCTIADDCPSNLFEQQRARDADFFKTEGEHLYTNFETEEQKD